MARHRKNDYIQEISRGKHGYPHVSHGSTGAISAAGYSILSRESSRHATGCQHTAMLPGRKGVVKIMPSMWVHKHTLPEQGAIGEFMNAIELESALHPTRKTLVHLERPLLVGLNLRQNGETIKVFCDSRDIGYNTLRITTPCKLGIKPGMQMKLDLFLGDSANAIHLDARVTRIDPSHAEDIVRFVVELEYTTLSSVAQAEICHLIQESSLGRPPHLLT